MTEFLLIAVVFAYMFSPIIIRKIAGNYPAGSPKGRKPSRGEAAEIQIKQG